MKSLRILSATFGLLAVVLPGAAGAQTLPKMVQVPMVTPVLGVPGTTFTGAVANTSCASTTPGYLDASGSGCPATQTAVTYIYAVAVDAQGDLAVSDAATYGVRVVYQGGSAMAKLITGALPGYTFTPMVGHSYTLTASGTSGALTLQSNGKYYCSNALAAGIALNAAGDGCAAQYVYAQARTIAMDTDGNIFFGEYTPFASIHVIYAGGARAANLINAYNPTVAQAGGPVAGYVYGLSSLATTTTSTDFVTIGGLGIQVVSATQENLFVADRGTSAAETGLLVATSGNQIKEFVCPVGTTGCNTTVNGNSYTAVGWATYIAGTTTSGVNGDGAPVAPATQGGTSSVYVDSPYTLTFDPGGDLFIGDNGNKRIRVVYHGGTMLPLYNSNALVPSPVIGNIYTVAGGGTGSASGVASNTLSVTPQVLGLDANGNLYFVGSSILWMESAVSGKAVAIGWMDASSASYATNANPQAGAYCNGQSSGPVMTDVYGDGCPATEVLPDNETASVIPFDAQGNFYIAEVRTTGTASAMLHKYSYGNEFGAVAGGTSSTQTLAFTPSTSGGSVTYTPAFPPAYTSADFSDAGGDVCTTGTVGITTQTCVVNVSMKPVLAGARMGSVSLSQTGTALATVLLGGVGTGAQIAIDPATTTTGGAGLQTAGVAVDAQNNTYVSSGGSTGTIYKNLATFATGLVNPAQLALDGAGNVYVADSGNNRIALVPAAGGAAAAFLGGSFTVVNPATVPATFTVGATLQNPAGVAVDVNGNVYIADTGNNRILEVTASFNGLANQVVQLNVTGLSSPQGIVVDASGNLFVSNNGGKNIVEYSAAGVQSVASSGYTPSISSPVSVAVDAADNLYVADAGLQQVVMLPAGATTAIRLVGSSPSLTGVAADNAGDVYISDAVAGLTVLNRTSPGYAFTGTSAVGSTLSSLGVTLTNSGYSNALTLGSPMDSQSNTAGDFLLTPGTSNGCTTSTSLTPGQQCTLSAAFQPQSIAAAASTVTFPASNAVNMASLTLSPGTVKLALSYTVLGSGTVVGTINTKITATVSTNANSTLSGTVNFIIDGGAAQGATIANGIATITVPLTAGTHTVAASSGGSYSNSLTFSVVAGVAQIALTSLPVAPTVGQSVTVTAAIATSNSSAAATGTVTFTVGGVAQTPVAFAATEKMTFSPPIGTTAVTVSYSGDANYSPALQSINITATKAVSVTTLQVTPVVASTGDTITLRATVSPQTPLLPTGTVTFTYGGNTTSAVALVNGSASFTTATNQLSSYSFSATYSGDINFLGSANTVTPSAAFVETLASSTMTVPQNAQLGVNVQFDPFFNYAGTIQVSCTNLPANTVCTTLPAGGLALGSTASQTIQLLVTTNAAPAAVQSARLGGGTLFMGGIAVSLCLLLPWWKRRITLLLVAMLMLGGALALSGCGATSTASGMVYQTPTGTYSVNVVATDGTNTSTQALSLTVIAGSNDARPSLSVGAGK